MDIENWIYVTDDEAGIIVRDIMFDVYFEKIDSVRVRMKEEYEIDQQKARQYGKKHRMGEWNHNTRLIGCYQLE